MVAIRNYPDLKVAKKDLFLRFQLQGSGLFPRKVLRTVRSITDVRRGEQD